MITKQILLIFAHLYVNCSYFKITVFNKYLYYSYLDKCEIKIFKIDFKSNPISLINKYMILHIFIMSNNIQKNLQTAFYVGIFIIGSRCNIIYLWKYLTICQALTYFCISVIQGVYSCYTIYKKELIFHWKA